VPLAVILPSHVTICLAKDKQISGVTLVPKAVIISGVEVKRLKFSVNNNPLIKDQVVPLAVILPSHVTICLAKDKQISGVTLVPKEAMIGGADTEMVIGVADS
jgi:hypothetical protein